MGLSRNVHAWCGRRVCLAVGLGMALLAMRLDGLAGAESKWAGKGDYLENPIEIRADRLELRRSDHLAIYEGHVVAQQEEYRLLCERLEVHWDPETSKISTVIARGDVKLETEEGHATSGVATLDVVSRVIKLTESPRLLHGEEYVEGEQIIYSINTRTSSVLAGSGKRVRTRIIPKVRR